jgi:hypothetical protein
MSGSNSSARVDAPPPNPDPVALTVHSMPAPDAAVLDRRTRTGRLKMLLVLAVCAAPVVASYFTYYVIKPQGRTNYSTLIQPSRSLPAELPLRTLDGQAVAPASLRGQWLLITVGAAACDADCDKRLFMQRQWRTLLGRDRDRLDKVWLVTDDAPVDPKLRAVLEGSDPVTTLRVPREAVAAWLQPEEGRTLEQHHYIVDPMGEWMMRVPVDPDPARVKRDLERLMRASTHWDKAGR